jgi:hypothetical protein
VTQDERNATQPQDHRQIGATQQVLFAAKVPHSDPALITYDEDRWEAVSAVTNIKKRAHDECKLAKSDDFRSSTIDHHAADSSSMVASDENPLTSNLSHSLILEDRLEPKTPAVSHFEQENIRGRIASARFRGVHEETQTRQAGRQKGMKECRNGCQIVAKVVLQEWL